MKQTELYWLAGILEGEGSFMKPSPSTPRLPRVSVQMTDEDVIARVATLIGNKYQTCIDVKNPTYKPLHSVKTVGKKAVDLMRLLRPLMGIRRQKQIDAALATYTTYVPRSPRRKLDAQGIANVVMLANSGLPQREIGDAMGICHSSVSRILAGRTYRTA
jgi:hypothetical protein